MPARRRSRVWPTEVVQFGELLHGTGHTISPTNLQRHLRCKSSLHPSGYGACHSALGVLYQALNRREQALTSYQRALPLSAEVSDQGLSQCCTGLGGLVLNGKGRRDEALTISTRAALLELHRSRRGEEVMAAPRLRAYAPESAQLLPCESHRLDLPGPNEPVRAVEY